MKIFELVSKMFNEVQPTQFSKMDFTTIWEVVRQGFIIKKDKTRRQFYEEVYNKLYTNKLHNAEDVAKLSYSLQKINKEIKET